MMAMTNRALAASQSSINSSRTDGREPGPKFPYLKVALLLLNERSNEIDFKTGGRPLVLQDFNTLTSEQMLKIVVTLLRELTGDMPISKMSSLSNFNKFGVGHVTYDSGIDEIYHAVKKLFPEDDEAFHYSALLLPSLDPVKAKFVITYITMFYTVCDKVFQQFSDCFEGVIADNEEKVAICTQMDGIKDEVSKCIQQKQAAAERLPTMQREILKVEERIRKMQLVLSQKTDEVEQSKVVYQGKEQQLEQVRQNLAQIDAELRSLESQIVRNPADIRSTYTSAKQQVEGEASHREILGSECNELKDKADNVHSCIDRVNGTIHKIENVASKMRELKASMIHSEKSEGLKPSSKLDKLRDEIEELKRILSSDSSLLELKKSQASKVEDLQRERFDFETGRKQTLDKVRRAKDTKESIAAEIRGIQQEIGEHQRKIAEYCVAVRVGIPQREAAVVAATVRGVNNIVDSLSKTSMPRHDKK